MCKPSALIVFFGLLLMFEGSVKGSNKDVELYNLRWDWQVYHDKKEQYVPFFKQTQANAIRFGLDFNKYKNAHLKLILQENTFLWVEDQLVYRSIQNSPLYFSLDSLYQVHQRPKAYMTIYHSEMDNRNIITSIVNRGRAENKRGQVFFDLRKNKDRTDLFVLISMVSLVLITLFRSTHYRLFQEYFSLGRALQQRQSFDLILAYSPMAWPNIGFVMFYAILVGTTAMNVGLFYNPDAPFTLPLNISYQNSIINGLKITGYCFVLMILKLLLVYLSAQLFKLRKLQLIHFFAYFRHSLIIAIVVFSLSLLNGMLEGALVSNGWAIFQVIVLIVWSGRVIQIFFVLNKIYTFRKLHLFSYLCSTELIPLLLFFKIFLK